MTFQSYRALTVTQLKLYLRNPLAVSGVLLTSLILILVLRFVDYSKSSHIKLAVANHSRSATAQHLVRELRRVPYFDVTLTTQTAAMGRLSNGKADLAVIVPANLDQAGKPGAHPLQLRVWRDAEAAGEQGLLFLQLAVDRFAQELSHASPSVVVSAELRHEHRMGVLDGFLPGLLAMNVIQAGLLLVAGTFATYRSTGVLRRIQATGIDSASFVLAHATASLLLGLLQAGVLLGVAVALFSLKVDIVALMAITGLGYLVFLAMGFAISGWVTDPQRTPTVAAALGMPMMFVAFFPSDMLPAPLTVLIGALPVAFVIDGVRHLGQGAGVASIAMDLVGLGLWSLVLLSAATRIFRWEGKRG